MDRELFFTLLKLLFLFFCASKNFLGIVAAINIYNTVFLQPFRSTIHYLKEKKITVIPSYHGIIVVGRDLWRSPRPTKIIFTEDC